MRFISRWGVIIILAGVVAMSLTLKKEKNSEFASVPTDPNLAVAVFAGGCFWCMQPPFQNLPGVVKVVSGYTGGTKENPTYEEVSSGKTGHVEAVAVYYDPAKIGYNKLLDVFWRNIDPTDRGGQFADRGRQYITAIYYQNDEQKKLAEDSRTALEKSGKFKEPVVTPILPAHTFYPAEEYHQNYHVKNASHYKQYREGSGRSGFLKLLWGDKSMGGGEALPAPAAQPDRRPSDRELKERLTPQQYDVAVCSFTETPFKNEYWDNKRDGIYVDVISGDPLFSSKDKFESGTGWPSFTRPIEKDIIIEKEDASHGMQRTEVRSKSADTHLGHLFTDGPAPTHRRYCVNSASLRFIPKEDLEKKGYGKYKKLFE